MVERSKKNLQSWNFPLRQFYQPLEDVLLKKYILIELFYKTISYEDFVVQNNIIKVQVKIR